MPPDHRILTPNTWPYSAKILDLIGSEHPVGAIACLHQLARVHAVGGVEQNGRGAGSPSDLQPSTSGHFALRHVDYLCSSHQRRIYIERRDCRPPGRPSSDYLDHLPLLFEREGEEAVFAGVKPVDPSRIQSGPDSPRCRVDVYLVSRRQAHTARCREF